MSTTAATILLVDDEESIQKLLTYPLERDGYRVVQARDGDEALRRFDEEPIDLVVLDVMLPKLDGLEVCKQLRATSFVPIIMLTARDDEVDKVLGLELGADDYITKPFSIREFRSRVRAALRRAATPRHDSREPEPIAIEGLTIDPARRTVDVGGRLSLALLLVVAGSLALVYLVVIPSLQSRLIEGKIAQLRRERTTLIRRYHEDVGSGLVFVDDAASIVNARFALYRIFSQKPAFTISPIQDSSGYRLSTDIQRDPIALRSAA